MTSTHDGIAVAPAWPAPPSVRACTTLRIGGASTGRYAHLNLAAHVGDEPARVAENRRRVAERLRLPRSPCWLEQVHGTRVLDLDAGESGDADIDLTGREARADSVRRDGLESAPEPADGAVTGRPGIVCAVLTADCVPVLLADRQGRRVGAAHAGWRGLVHGVLPAAVEALGSSPADVIAWLGPAIGQAAFEVGDEVRTAFAERGFAVERAFERNARGRWQADLYALAAESLRRVGVTAIFGGEYCTYSEPDRFFSHRREAPCGRMASLIWIDGGA